MDNMQYIVIGWFWNEEYKEYLPEVLFIHNDRDEALKYYEGVKLSNELPQVDFMVQNKDDITRVTSKEYR